MKQLSLCFPLLLPFPNVLAARPFGRRIYEPPILQPKRSRCRSLEPEFQAIALPVSSTKPGVDEGDNRDDTTGTSNTSTSSSTLPGLWPPWPFNLFSKKPSTVAIDHPTTHRRSYSSGSRSGPAIAWSFAVESLRVSLKNVQDITSNLWRHLPPAAPPFLVLAAIPRRETVEFLTEGGAEEVTRRVVVPLISNAFCRSIAFAGAGVGIISWAHYDWHRKRSLTPLPLPEEYRDCNRAILPPFLPEERRIDLRLLQGDNPRVIPASAKEIPENEEDDDDDDDDTGKGPKRFRRRNWNQFAESRPESSFSGRFPEWKRRRELNRLERSNARRLAIYDELVALQSLKRKASPRRSYFMKRPATETEEESSSSPDSLGYALVTGASRGIGRAIAVELARWEIPLILVARDIEKLTSLANDLEACYGVKCCVLQADLAKPGVAENVYKTTERAGLKVEILVNNAGFSTQGIAVDRPIWETNQMMQLNAVSTSILASLYGREMKKRRRGRILMVSSICGNVAGIPSVALYSATKAFQNSLATAMAVEMEANGVGVTCLTPGAVRGTEFRSRSKTKKALCWKLPFYAKSPPQVASMGVRSLLRGDTEVTPGWQNRLFVKVLKPCLPQRLHNLCAEIMWSPVRSPFRRKTE